MATRDEQRADKVVRLLEQAYELIHKVHTPCRAANERTQLVNELESVLAAATEWST